jgi:hypothetical protein
LPAGKEPVAVKDCPEKRIGEEVSSDKDNHKKVPSEIKDKSKPDLVDQIQTSFGDLSALAGDHAQGTADLRKKIHRFSKHDVSEEDRFLATRRHWVQACRWYRGQVGIKSDRLSSLEECFDQYPQESFDALAQQYPGTTKGYEPSRIELAEFERLSGYVGLANSNRAHFPKHSWRVYHQYHLLAMECAKAYRGKPDFEKCQDGEGKEREPAAILARALLYEGFAQHFLQDSFSSGHIGTNFGFCLWIFCNRNKRIVQHTHDELNALGIEVKLHGIEPRLEGMPEHFSEGAKEGWTAYGDRHLFIPEASFHRRIVEFVAAESIAEVLRAMHMVDTSPLSCLDMVRRFPVPKESTEDLGADCENISKKQESDLTHWSGPRSPDRLVPDLPVEGWKFLVTWGILRGEFTHLNEDRSPRGTRNGVTFGTFEIGYVRSTSWWIPNYLGFGTTIAPGNRFSVYPISVGYWRPTDVRSFFYGIRLNMGVRITEPFSVENPTTHRDDTFELNVPLDLGYEIYPPVAVYLRAELLNVNFPVLPSKAVVDSIFVGRGGVTLGLRFDLAEILP